MLEGKIHKNRISVHVHQHLTHLRRQRHTKALYPRNRPRLIHRPLRQHMQSSQALMPAPDIDSQPRGLSRARPDPAFRQVKERPVTRVAIDVDVEDLRSLLCRRRC